MKPNISIIYLYELASYREQIMNITLLSLDFHYISCSIRNHYTISEHIVGPYFAMLYEGSFLVHMFFLSIPVCHEPIGNACRDNAATDSQQINKRRQTIRYGAKAASWKNALQIEL